MIKIDRYDPSSAKVVLGCSGGGARGVMTAQALCWLQERVHYPLHELIDLGGGSSTGGFISAALACGLEPSKIKQIYCDNAAKVFRRTLGQEISNPDGLWNALYDKKALSELLTQFVGDRKYEETAFPLVISTFVTNDGVGAKVYNQFDPVLPEDGSLHTALLATSAAPTFFNDTHDGKQACIDGGMWANAPCQMLSAYAEGQHLGWDPGNILLINLGCGHTPMNYDIKHSGLSEEAPRIVDTLLEAQRSGAELLCRQRFGERFTYCEPILKAGQDILNDGSPKFMQQMIAVMDNWIEQHSGEMLLLAAKLNTIGAARAQN